MCSFLPMCTHVKCACRLSPHRRIAIALAYPMRLRGIEVLTLTEENADDHDVRTNGRKESRDGDVLWSPRPRAAWDAVVDRRTRAWRTRRLLTPRDAAQRYLLASDQGRPIRRGALDTLWRNRMPKAVEQNVIAAKDRFGIHDLKRKGITDTAGTRGEKHEASGHRSGSMMDVYALSVPRVTTPGGV